MTLPEELRETIQELLKRTGENITPEEVQARGWQ